MNLLQVNDVYEISALEHGTVGGMARVAALRNELVKENPNTYTMLAGDFLSPSAIGTLSYEGKRIMGRQMVELMNAVPVDLVTFGNHEFDLREDLLLQRINESSFDWVSANILHKTASGNVPFVRTRNGRTDTIPPVKIITFTDADSTTLRVGVFGLTI
ncbi:MAG TPA: metallophosphoesterase, partial [Chitinophagaceae bacterium]|nr:metallophosphoesterase [Chitinophagaceae bacterium]